MDSQLQPSNAFIATSWAALLAAFIIGLWNAVMPLMNEKSYCLTGLMHGLIFGHFLAKERARPAGGIPVTNSYYGLSWFSAVSCILMLSINFRNATLALILSKKGFYAMSFLLSMFVVIVVQKNTCHSRCADTAQ